MRQGALSELNGVLGLVVGSHAGYLPETRISVDKCDGSLHPRPMPPNILSFMDALTDAEQHAKRLHLLLGNGFSIACRPHCFSYAALLDEATFDGAAGDIPRLFELLGTADFERVIEALRTAALLADVYAADHPLFAAQLRTDAEVIREALATTLAAKHPDLPFDLDDSEYEAVRTFLSKFEKLYTLNYDMLLYWSVMQDGNESVPTDDGFRAPSDADAPHVTWEPYFDYSSQRLFFLHGGLHLYDSGSEISKITWSRTGIPLVDQIRDALVQGRYPLIVTEGNTADKEAKILHNAYLTHALRSLARIQNVLFVYGHSLAPNDDHILRRIADGKISRLYVSLYGDASTSSNQEIVARAEALAAARPTNRPLTVQFFDAETANVWA